MPETKTPKRPAAKAPPTGIHRVRYRERMLLTAADLQVDEAYRTGAHRRHLLSGHDWGIVFGLALETVTWGDERVTRLQPGVAVDGFGRELVLSREFMLPAPLFDGGGPDALDVWLLYGRQSQDSQHVGYWDCGPGGHDRWLEAPLVRLSIARGPHADPWAGVPPSALVFQPWQDAPTEPQQEWPVFLGRLHRNGSPDLSRRLYASLRGETVAAPSGSTRLVLGSDATDANLRFAVAIPALAPFPNRLAIDRDGNTSLRGVTRVLEHDLTVAQPASPGPADVSPCERPPDTDSDARYPIPAIEFRPPAKTPEAAAPWHVYRTHVVREGAPRLDQLRVETGAPEGSEDPSRYRLAIGHCDPETNAFVPCLTVDASCNVRISGHLEVSGQISTGPLRPDPESPLFDAILAGSWLQGANAATLQATGPAGVQVTVTHDAFVHDASNPVHVTLKNLGGTAVRDQRLTLLYTNTGAAPPPPVTEGPVSFAGEISPGHEVTHTLSIDTPGAEGDGFELRVTFEGTALPGLPVRTTAIDSGNLIGNSGGPV